MKTKVDPKYQGQGIAANMYALIRMLGVNILPSETQTNAGKQMWSKWRKQGDVNSLKDLDPKVKGVAESENNDTAISLSKLGKFHPGTDELAEFVPERATAHYALHPDKWESTFYSLTNKDSDKLKYYGPKKISIPPGTLVGDMAIANKFYRAKTSEEKQQYAEAYKASLQSYPVDVSQYRMPELLIPRQNVGEEYNTMQFAAEKTPAINPYGGRKDNQYRGGISEASGYIPSEKQKNDPRFKTALTVDVHPDTIKKNAKAFYWNTSRAGIPPTAKANGKIS
jgi:hypothetical protein